MAPTRKFKSVNKQYSSIYEVSPDKDAGNSRKSKPKKKLADKLGSQWSKAEIERFYKAYREYGKDWNKVAAAVRNRSIEMVEALYNVNRAYLSLPDGVASVIGLIAMMTDQYSVLGKSDGERESNEQHETPRKAQKRKREKVHLGSSKEDVFEPRTIASSQEYSLLKSADLTCIYPRAVGKRTPRVPISYSQRKPDTESFNPPNKRVKKSELDDNDDEQVAALTLTRALQRVSSPQVSQRPNKEAECRKSPPVQSYDSMLPQSETTKAKLRNSSYKCLTEGRLEGMEPTIGTYATDTVPLMDMKGVGTVTSAIEAHQKEKKFYRQKVKVEENMKTLSDDGGEACSGTEEGIIDSALKGKGKVDMEISSAKSEVSPWSQRKRSKKLVFGDECSSLDALLTLANLSTSMLPKSIMESESSVKSKENRITVETGEKSSLPEAASRSHHTDKIKHLGPKEKVSFTGAEDGTSRKSKVGRHSGMDDKVVSEPKQQLKPTNNSLKRKRNSFSTKISNLEALMDSPLRQLFDNKDMAEEENTKLAKGKGGAQSSVQSRQRKSFRVPEDSPTTNDPKMAGIDSEVSTSQVPAPNSVSLPNKHQNRRKANLKRALLSTDINSKYTLKDQPNKHSLSQVIVKQKLSSCLSSDLARRWCCFEWFYGAIDYAWFAKREFVEYLNHVGLGLIPRLTRVEWGVIRSSLGKPRRFSECFLHEEREKLKRYRESVRQLYTQLHNGTREGLPTDLAHPISVGQRVIAIHPKTREVHDGKVLTVYHDSCRVQFDSPELGVEIVMDIDCMPSNPLENMPETLRRQNLAFDEFSVTPNESQVNGHLDFGGSVCTSSGHAENATNSVNLLTSPIKVDVSRNILHAKTAVPNVVSAHQTAYGLPLTTAHIQEREADIRVMSEVNLTPDKKEALPMELRNTNNDILENRNGKSCLKGSEPFKKHISTASSPLLTSRQHNSHPANTRSLWQKSDCSVLEPEPGSVVSVIVRGSRLKAHSMVDAAIKAMSSMKEGEDPFMRIGEALDSVNIRQENGCFSFHNNWPTGRSPNPKLQEASENTNEQVLSELITSCIATLLMIQTCTEQRYRLGDLAQIIDAAVKSLRPCCLQSLPIYQDIQMCMGRIKTMLLAFRPSGV